jgi:dCTP deaminase
MSRSSPASLGHLLVDREITALLGGAIRASAGAARPSPAQVSPSSVDLRLGPRAWRIRSGFLPGGSPLEDRLRELAINELSLEGAGAVLERGLVYLVQLEEELELPADVRGRFNPRSSTGRCDIFTRVLCEGHPRFDETPLGYRGRSWIEIAPLSFPVRLKRGDRLCQLRLQRGQATLTSAELRAVYRATPLCFERVSETAAARPTTAGRAIGGAVAPGAAAPGAAAPGAGTPGAGTPAASSTAAAISGATSERPLGIDEVSIDDEGCLALRVGLSGRDPAGWRAAAHTDVLEFARDAAHDPRDFWDEVHAHEGHCILGPGSFYVFASRERLRIPPELAAEMLPVDVGIGELRNNYAGFFDNGFGWREDAQRRPLPSGTPAVLEVRAHDVPFLVEDGQVFGRVRFFKSSARPDRLYGEGRAASYRDQDLTLARCFKTR